jgi:adenylosuccinate synthase
MSNVAIIGLQWGDEGKGKLVDFLSNSFDAVVRFQGGHNAGHTIKANNNTYKLSILPSGLIQNKYSVIASGVVIDPFTLLNEINNLKQSGIDISPKNLNIADNCSLIFSFHKDLDSVLENNKGKKKIGTTNRGIGPSYEDRVGRRSIRICDLMNEDILSERLENILFYHNVLRRGFGLEEINLKLILKEILTIRDKILPYCKDSFEITQKLQSKKKVMFEGAQGALLDVANGTYPFVTSSHTLSGSVFTGGCINVGGLDKTIGILKAYTTRVGSGPFPTELNDKIGEFLKKEGHEIGTVTGRDRRCGWFDAALVKKAIILSNIKSVVLTKLDVLDKLEKIKICTSYEIDGKIYDYLPNRIDLQNNIKPIYEEIDGWQESVRNITKIEDLPENAIKYIKKIEEICNINIDIISTGPDRTETIIVNPNAI